MDGRGECVNNRDTSNETKQAPESSKEEVVEIQEGFQAKIFALELLHPSVYGAKEDVEFGTSRGACAASGVHVPTDTHIQGSPDGAHSVALHDNLEGIDDHEECFECIGGGGGEKKATLKIDTVMASPGDSYTSCPVKLESAHSQGITGDSENLSTTEKEHDNEHKGERGSFKNTTNNTELKRESHSGNLEVNGNDVYLESMSTGLICSHVTAQIGDKIQSSLKKSELPVKKRVTFKIGHHSTETRQVEHRCDTESLAMKGPIRHPVIAKLGRELKLKLERISLPMKGECHNATSVGAKVSNRDVQKERTVKTRKSVLDTGDIRSPKRYKTVGLISNKNVFTENRSVMRRNRHSKAERSKSVPVIKRNKQFGMICDCEVKLERLSPEFLGRALSGQKKQQSAETRSVTQVHERCKTDNSFYFQKSEDINNGAKEKIDRSLIVKEEDGSFGMQIIDDTWGSDRIDAWGNVRYLLKGHSDLSECDEDWYGWWVRVDSLQNFCDAHLYSISDGVTESRIMVWDNNFEAKPAPQNNTVQVPEQTEYAREESQPTDEEWAGWKVLYIEKSVGDVNSFGFSDEEAGEFYGW